MLVVTILDEKNLGITHLTPRLRPAFDLLRCGGAAVLSLRADSAASGGFTDMEVLLSPRKRMTKYHGILEKE